MFRPLAVALLVVFCGAHMSGQQAAPVQDAKAVNRFPDRTELLRLIGLYEAAAKSAEAAHWKDPKLVDVYLSLGGMYEEVAMYPKAEDALTRAVALLRDGPDGKLAEGLDHLALLHGAMGGLRKAEGEAHEALRLRERDGDAVGIGRSMNSLAQLSSKQGHFTEALGYAQRAMDTLGNDPSVALEERIGVRQLLADALCRTHACGKAVPLLLEKVQMAKDGYGAESLPVALARYRLGYAYWQNGDMSAAEVWMEQGIEGMKAQFGWGHPIYLDAMQQYAKFLRQRGQLEAASTAEREVRQAQSVVDARSFTGRGR